MRSHSGPKRLPVPHGAEERTEGEEEALSEQREALARKQAIEVATIRVRALVSEGYLDRAEETFEAAVSQWGGHPDLDRLQDRIRSARKRQALLAHPGELIEHVKAMRSNGELSNAVDLLRHAIRQGANNPEILSLLGQIQLDLRRNEEKEARLALVSETRLRVEQHVELGELFDAEATLAQAVRVNGSCEELEELKVWLQELRHQQQAADLAPLLDEAQRLEDEDRLQEAVVIARQALVLDPQNEVAAAIVDSVGDEVEDQQEVQDLPTRDNQLHRRRRLRKVRWARRREQFLNLGRAIPVERLRALPGSILSSAAELGSRSWNWTTHRSSAASGWTRRQFQAHRRLQVRKGLVWTLLLLFAAAGMYLVTDIPDTDGADGAQIAGESINGSTLSSPKGSPTIASHGDLIIDALPWGRIVAIVDQNGEEQNLDEDLFTPVRLSLPAGAYRVVLENPTAEEPAEFWVQVTPSALSKKVHEFAPLDADAYFAAAWRGRR